MSDAPWFDRDVDPTAAHRRLVAENQRLRADVERLTKKLEARERTEGGLVEAINAVDKAHAEFVSTDGDHDPADIHRREEALFDAVHDHWPTIRALARTPEHGTPRTLIEVEQMDAYCSCENATGASVVVGDCGHVEGRPFPVAEHGTEGEVVGEIEVASDGSACCDGLLSSFAKAHLFDAGHFDAEDVGRYNLVRVRPPTDGGPSDG